MSFHQLSSHTLEGSLLPQEETGDTFCSIRAKKEPAISERVIPIAPNNLTKLCRAKNLFGPPTSEKHSSAFERFQQWSAGEKVAVCSTVMISGYKNRDIYSLMIMSLPASFHEKAKNRGVQNAFMLEKILVDTFFLEKLNKLKKDYKS